MSAYDAPVSRRSFVTGAAVALGLGAAGGAGLATAAGVTGGTALPGAAAVRGAAIAAGTVLTHLAGRDWRQSRPGPEPGRAAAPGTLATTSGALVDADGRDRGAFRSVALGGTAYLHLLELDDGTLLGMGSGDLDEATYAVVGGTGAYRGAAGTYTVSQRPREAGGDGTADFTFALLTPGS
jgi:hypothetical protein